MEEIRQKLKNACLGGSDDSQTDKLKAQLSELEKQEEEWRRKEEDLKMKEKVRRCLWCVSDQYAFFNMFRVFDYVVMCNVLM
jgi:hypothetical protein